MRVIDPNIEILRHLEQNLTKVVTGKGDQRFTQDEVEIAQLIRYPRGVIIGRNFKYLDNVVIVDPDLEYPAYPHISGGSIRTVKFSDVEVLQDVASDISEFLDVYVDIEGLTDVPEDISRIRVELYVRYREDEEDQEVIRAHCIASKDVDISSGVVIDDKLNFVCVVMVAVVAYYLEADLGVHLTYIDSEDEVVNYIERPDVDVENYVDNPTAEYDDDDSIIPTVDFVYLYANESAFRIRATKQFDADALRYQAETPGPKPANIAIENALNDDYQITFHEWRGRRHSYLPIVESHFVFECYGPGLEKAHLLFALVDKFLHDPCPGTGSREILFGDLYIYSSLRARLPELYLELESRGVGLPQFAVAYRLIYSEQEV